MAKWMKIPGYSNKITKDGRVRSMTRRIIRKNGHPHTARGKILHPWTDNHGYRMVRVHRESDGGREDIGIHRLLLLTFVGPCPEGMECRHLNDVPDDNRLENICWGTRKEQAKDRKKNGNSHYRAASRGEEQWCSKLTEEKVREIKKLKTNERGAITRVGKMFGVSSAAVWLIWAGRNWRHVTLDT